MSVVLLIRRAEARSSSTIAQTAQNVAVSTYEPGSANLALYGSCRGRRFIPERRQAAPVGRDGTMSRPDSHAHRDHPILTGGLGMALVAEVLEGKQQERGVVQELAAFAQLQHASGCRTARRSR